MTYVRNVKQLKSILVVVEEEVIIRHSECEVVEYDNSENMDIKIGEQFLIYNSIHIEVMNIEDDYVDYKKVFPDGKFNGTIYRMERVVFKERAIPIRLTLKSKLDKLGKRNWVNADVCKEAMEFEEQINEIVKEKPKMKCEVLKEEYSHRLREAIQCFLEENEIEEVISLSCYFDSSTDYHVAVVIYK